MKKILAWIFLFIAPAAFGQAGRVGHSGAVGGTGMLIGNAAPVPGGALPLTDAPVGGTCSTLYEGTYQLGIWKGCTNTPPTNWAATATSLMANIQPRNTSGTTGSGSAFKIVMIGTGMSVALAEFSSFSTATGALTNVRLANEAVSNNDSDTWSTPCEPSGTVAWISFRQTCSAPGSTDLWAAGRQPDPCQSTVGGSSSGSAQCPAQGLNGPTNGYWNFGDRITSKLAANTPALGNLQVQVAWMDTANGTLHPYLQGILQSGFQTTSVYIVGAPLDGTHLLNDESQQNVIDAVNVGAAIAQDARNMKREFPNLVQLWLSGRITAINCISGCANPEPLDYQISLAARAVWNAQACQLGDSASCGVGQSVGGIDNNFGDLCPKAVSCGAGSAANAAPMIMPMDVQASVSHDGNTHSGLWWTTRSSAVPPQPIAQLEDSTVFFCFGESSSPCLGALDFASDGIHLTSAGGTKAGNIMLRVFQNSPYSQPWFN